MSIGMLVLEASVLIVIANAMRLLRRHGSVDSAPAGPTTRWRTVRSPVHIG
jgi:Cd2+/Zn2+-exporting ATPase